MAARVPAPDSCKLYQLDVAELLRDREKHQGVLESLASIGLTVECLQRMATNPRHELAVLLGPTDTWNEHGPAVYCAIQVCLEGNIPHVPGLDENDPLNMEIKKYFLMFPQLPNDLLIGVKIVEIFLLPDVPQEEYQSTTLKLLRRYFNGEVAEHVMEQVPKRQESLLTRLHTKQGRIHYLGTFANPSIDDVQRWERNGFKLFYVGYLEENSVTCVMLSTLDDYETFVRREYANCSLDDLFKAFCRIFTRLLGYWREFDRVLALRILRENMVLVRQGDQRRTRKKPWSLIEAGDVRLESCSWNQRNIEFVKVADKRIEAFIRNHHKIELVTDLVAGIAQSYFGGALYINLAESEEYILMLMGLNGHTVGKAKEALNLEEIECLACVSRVFETTLDYFNTLSPEVVDD